jgi:hypothetical protein
VTPAEYVRGVRTSDLCDECGVNVGSSRKHNNDSSRNGDGAHDSDQNPFSDDDEDDIDQSPGVDHDCVGSNPSGNHNNNSVRTNTLSLPTPNVGVTNSVAPTPATRKRGVDYGEFRGARGTSHRESCRIANLMNINLTGTAKNRAVLDTRMSQANQKARPLTAVPHLLPDDLRVVHIVADTVGTVLPMTAAKNTTFITW